MEKSSFNTIEELQAEIGILRMKRNGQEIAIHEKFNGPGAIFKTVKSLFISSDKKSLFDEVFNQDIITNISRVMLPMILNSSVFRGSGFITKTLVTLFSQKAAKNVNMDLIISMIEKVKGLFDKNKTGKGSKVAVEDYGIPPDSETY
ncbi:MAG TPA: hypothetical protein DIT07_05835 [Sphingobacteriaceae bacterium]|nr:hypothetical protein [Sphingobacteriaceae bacterium]